MLEDNINDRGKVHVLRWHIYKKDKEDLIRREFLVGFPHMEGGEIFVLM